MSGPGVTLLKTISQGLWTKTPKYPYRHETLLGNDQRNSMYNLNARRTHALSLQVLYFVANKLKGTKEPFILK